MLPEEIINIEIFEKRDVQKSERFALNKNHCVWYVNNREVEIRFTHLRHYEAYSKVVAYILEQGAIRNANVVKDIFLTHGQINSGAEADVIQGLRNCWSRVSSGYIGHYLQIGVRKRGKYVPIKVKISPKNRNACRVFLSKIFESSELSGRRKKYTIGVSPENVLFSDVAELNGFEPWIEEFIDNHRCELDDDINYVPPTIVPYEFRKDGNENESNSRMKLYQKEGTAYGESTNAQNIDRGEISEAEIAELFYGSKPVVVFGDPGHGKTSFLRHWVFKSLKGEHDYCSNGLCPIPVYINLTGEDETSPQALLKAKMRELLDRNHYNLRTTRRSFILLFDGLDRMQSANKQQLVEKALRLSGREWCCNVIISSKTSSWNRAWCNPRIVEMFEIAGFCDPVNDEQGNLCRYIQNSNSGNTKLLLKLIRNNPRLLEICSIPFFANMICDLPADNLQELIRTPKRNLLFKKWTQNMVRKHRNSDGLWYSHGGEVFLSELAYAMTELGVLRIAYEDAMDMLKDVQWKTDNGTCFSLLARDARFLRSAGLPVSDEYLEFGHQCLQEYYSSKIVKKEGSALFLDKCRSKYLRERRWDEVILLFVESLEENEDILRVIELLIDHDPVLSHAACIRIDPLSVKLQRLILSKSNLLVGYDNSHVLNCISLLNIPEAMYTYFALLRDCQDLSYISYSYASISESMRRQLHQHYSLKGYGAISVQKVCWFHEQYQDEIVDILGRTLEEARLVEGGDSLVLGFLELPEEVRTLYITELYNAGRIKDKSLISHFLRYPRIALNTCSGAIAMKIVTDDKFLSVEARKSILKRILDLTPETKWKRKVIDACGFRLYWFTHRRYGTGELEEEEYRYHFKTTIVFLGQMLLAGATSNRYSAGLQAGYLNSYFKHIGIVEDEVVIDGLAPEMWLHIQAIKVGVSPRDDINKIKEYFSDEEDVAVSKQEGMLNTYTVIRIAVISTVSLDDAVVAIERDVGHEFGLQVLLPVILREDGYIVREETIDILLSWLQKYQEFLYKDICRLLRKAEWLLVKTRICDLFETLSDVQIIALLENELMWDSAITTARLLGIIEHATDAKQKISLTAHTFALGVRGQLQDATKEYANRYGFINLNWIAVDCKGIDECGVKELENLLDYGCDHSCSSEILAYMKPEYEEAIVKAVLREVANPLEYLKAIHKRSNECREDRLLYLTEAMNGLKQAESFSPPHCLQAADECDEDD